MQSQRYYVSTVAEAEMVVNQFGREYPEMSPEVIDKDDITLDGLGCISYTPKDENWNEVAKKRIHAIYRGL